MFYNENDIKERNIEILTCDRLTRKEAEDYLKQERTDIFEDFEENFDRYMEEWECDKEEIEKYKQMIEDRLPIRDWGVVEYEGKTYYIRYVL